FVARTAGLTERAARFDVDDAMRHCVQQVGQTRLQPRGNQGLAQGNSLPRRLHSPTRHAFSPVTDDTLAKRMTLACINGRVYRDLSGAPGAFLPSPDRPPKWRRREEAAGEGGFRKRSCGDRSSAG